MSGGWLTAAWLVPLAVLLPALFHQCCWRWFARRLVQSGCVRKNYQNRRVVTSGGLLVAATATFGMLTVNGLGWLTARIDPDWPTFAWFCAGSAVMLLLGLQDDRADDGNAKGFRGHFHAFWAERRLTSGLRKCLGGGMTAFLLSVAVSQHSLEVVVHTGLLALSSNLINLFDLRPTRALKAFWLAALCLLLAVPSRLLLLDAWLWALPAVTASMLFFALDARGRMMLGDAGANYLGFLFGFACLVSLPLSAKAVLLLLLVILHLLAEVVSFSRIIEAIPLLKRLDEWGRTA
ncbi:UDP-N-acetylmuramyl pentapeptide phosphotransferase [Brevibacillus marinus]|uniref:UDP-N-acetylmuramyl pentapeptide phosphotransferase n=1 Tax=Brevibacillus marinus TaxID=2496837 RepID=UPI000F84DDC4|nr:UDP-N-acetylmuramyl pentapeptide phosphotransferase [Brevibacillus marinus]